MARKPTKAELRKALLTAEWSKEELEDPRVLALRARRKQLEEERNAPPNFDNVRSGSSTKELSAGRTSLDKMGAAFTGGVADIGADLMFRDIDAREAEKIRRAEEDARIAGNNETFLGNLAPDFLERDFVSPTASKLAAAMGETEIYRKGFEGLSKYAEGKRADVDQEVAANIRENPVRGRVERTILDVLGSPQSLASIPGGAFAAIPAGTTYNDAYRKMREGGASPAAAAEYASMQAGVEGGISAIPAGNVLKVLSAPLRRGAAKTVTAPFRNNLEDIALRTGRTAVGETIEEMTQTVAGDLVSRYTATFGDDEKGREVAKQAISKDLLNDTLRAGAAGFAGGGALGSVHSSLQVARENARLVVEANKRLDQDEGARTRSAEASARNKAGEVQRDTGIDVAKANELLIGEDWRREAATSRLGRVNTSIEEAKAELQELNDLEYKSKMAEEAGQTVEPFDLTRKKRVGQRLVNLELAKNQLSDMLGKDAQGREMLATKAQQDAQAAAKAEQDLRQGVNVNPDQTGLGVAVGQLPVSKRQAAKNEAEAKRKAEEASLRDFANGSSSTAQAAPQGPSAARTLVQNLAKNRGKADSKRALSLLANGRIEIVNSPKDIGVNTAPGQRYKGMEREGKMYLFAESFDNNADLAPQLAATIFHETKHVGDFAEGDVNLPKNLAGFIGMDNAEPINRKIEAAATRGNKLAEAAVASAENARNAERNPARKNAVYEEELLPYFITQTKEARNKASGLGNIVADVRNAIKGQYQTMFGTDEGVSLDDVFKLSQSLTDYVAQNPTFNTQPKGSEPAASKTPTDRAMIVGPKSKSYAIAEKLGLTYKSKDGGDKYFLSDKASDFEISPEQVKLIKEAKGTQKVLLPGILKHEDIYNEYPFLRKVQVHFRRLGEGVHGQYMPNSQVIELSKDHLKAGGRNSPMHQTLIHELQHIIQEHEGTSLGSNPQLFLDNKYENDKMKEIQIKEDLIQFAKDVYRGSFKKYGISPIGSTPEVDSALQQVTDGVKGFMEEGYDQSTEDNMLSAAMHALYGLSQNPKTNTSTVKMMTNRAIDLASIVDQNKATYSKAHKAYEENLGEEEARYAQKNIDMDQEDAPTNPEKIYFPNAKPDMGETPDARAQHVREISTGAITGKLANPVARMQMVKHGTPHTFKAEPGHAFGRFRDDKMGTGEGAQAFGWGHYLTELWNTADTMYRKRLLGRTGQGREDESYGEAMLGNLIAEFDPNPFRRNDPTDEELLDILTDENIKASLDDDKRNLVQMEKQHKPMVEIEVGEMRSVMDRATAIANDETQPVTVRAAARAKAAKELAKLQQDWASEDWEGAFRASADRQHAAVMENTRRRIEFLENTTAEQFLKIAKLATQKGSEDGGEVYYVDIPEDSSLMDYDSPVSEQPLLKNIRDKYGADPAKAAASVRVFVARDVLTEREIDAASKDLLLVEQEDISGGSDRTVEQIKQVGKQFVPELREAIAELRALQNGDIRKPAQFALTQYVRAARRIEVALRNLSHDSAEELANVFEFSIDNASGLQDELIDGGPKTGQELYYAIENELGSDKAASKYLHDNGILGHYFQPPSQNRDTRNFVIYDESSLKITGRDAREKGLGRPETRELRRAAQERTEAAERASASKRAAFERDAREGRIDRFSAGPSGAEIAQDRNGKGMRRVKKIAGLFTAFGELGRELGVKAEEAVGEASYFADLAQTTSLRIKRGTKLAAQRLVAEGKATSLTDGIEKMNARIKGTLDSLVQMEEEGRRQSAIAGLVREHPELASIQDGYNLINDGTRQIVRQMLASKEGPLTDAEIAKMKTLIKNQTRYLTRAYAAFQGSDGKTWSQKLENEYSIAKAMVAKGEAVPAKYQESYKTYKAALDYVTRENVAVFDEAALSEMTLDKVRMVYDTWFSNRKGVEDEIKRTNDPDEVDAVKTQLIDAIVARGRDVNERQITNRSHKIVNGLLGLNETNNPVVTYYRGFKQDRSILMDRVDLPQELKDLFGEITDPALRIMLTISRQGELVSRSNLLLAIKNDMYGRKIISNEDKSEDNNDTFSQQLKGDTWGPLADHWVTPEVWETIRDDREIATNMSDAIGRLVLDANAVNTKLGVKALSYYTRLAGLQKVAAIVWNPAQTIWNFGGSWISGIKEGNVNPANYVRAGKAAAKLFAKEMQAAGAGGRVLENDPDVEDLIRYDVIDSAMVQEIRKLPNQYIRQMINDHGHVRNVLGKTTDISFAAVKQIFALSDLTVKIANYYHQVNHLEAYYAAEGVEVTPDTLKKEAADVIKDTNITFRRAAPIVKMGERAGLTYVMPYIQGVFRSSIYGYVHGIKDLVRSVNDAKTAKGKAIMMKHAMGRIAGSTTAIVLVQSLVRSVLTGDEEKDAKIRQLQTLDARYGDSVYVGDDAKGNPLMLRLSRFDPLGPLTDIVRIAHSDATTDQKNRDIAEHLHGLLIKPRLGQEILKSALEFVTNDKAPAVKPKGTKLERLFPRMTTATKDFLADAPGTDYNDGEALMGLLDTMLPGFTNIIDPNNAAVTGQSPQYKKPDASDSLVADMLRATGGRMDKIDVNMAAFVAGKDLSTVRMEARTRVFDKLQTVDATDRNAVMAITELLDDERKAFIRVKEVYEGMEAMGMSKGQIDKVLKEEGKLTAHDRHLLYSGKYDTSLEGWRTNGSSVLSKKSIEQRELQSDKRSPDEQTAAEKREAVKKAVRVLRELGIKVKE